MIMPSELGHGLSAVRTHEGRECSCRFSLLYVPNCFKG